MPKRWEVVGGGDVGGLVVREGRVMTSRQAKGRLSTGAIVEERELVGERLCYHLVSGTGPEDGWISVVGARGKELARPYEGEDEAPEAAPPQDAAPVEERGIQQSCLSRDEAWAMQEELIEAYAREAFQKRLAERWKAAGDDPVAKMKARQEVCLEVQGPIVKKYGFEDSRKGVTMSMNAFRTPELYNDQELTARTSRLIWLSDPAAREATLASWSKQESGGASPQAAAKKNDSRSAAAAVQLTVEQASAMQDDLIAAYMKADFQRQLRAAWKEAGDSPHKKAKVRQQVCLEVQGPIVAKYGFDASMDGVMWSLAAFGAPHIAYCEEIQYKNSTMLYLINPDEQDRQRKNGSVRVRSAGSEDVVLAELSVDLADKVRDFKEQIQGSTEAPWYSQRLWCGEHELLDHWPLGAIVDESVTADIIFQARRPEVTEWLARFVGRPETRDNSRCLAEAPAELLADEELVLPLVSLCRWALGHAAPALRAARHVVEAALLHSGLALEHVGDELRADHELVLLAVAGERGDAWALQFAAPELRADREIVRKAVLKDGWALQFATEEVRADREIVLLAAKREGWILSSISQELQADHEVVLTAVKQNWEVLECVAPELRADREVVLAAVRQDGWALEFAMPPVQSDREVVIEAVRDVGEALRFAAPELLTDREVAMAALSSDGLAISLVPCEIHDFEMILTAVSKDLRALQYIDQRFRQSVLEALGYKSGPSSPFAGRMPSIRTGKVPGKSSVEDSTAATAKHFQTLGLDKEATVSQIRKRYRALALEHHPDKHPEDPEKAKRTFQTINTAYQALREALGF